jgi:hypothetical protein
VIGLGNREGAYNKVEVTSWKYAISNYALPEVTLGCAVAYCANLTYNLGI